MASDETTLSRLQAGADFPKKNTLKSTALRIGLALLIAACPVWASEPQRPLFEVNSTKPLPDAKATYDEVRQLILKNYYTDSLTEADLYQASILGMLRHISPPHAPDQAKLWLPTTYQKIKQSLLGINASLGIQVNLNTHDHSLTVTAIDEHSPAWRKLDLYDRIMRINGEKLQGMSAGKINSLLNGIAGTRIKLTIVRDISIKQIELTLQPQQIKRLQASILENNTAYLRIYSFSRDIHQHIRQQIRLFSEKGINKLILDLRDNPGGIFLEGLKTAELFLPERSIILRSLSRHNKINNYLSSNLSPFQYQIIILTNQHTASASEVVAAALRTHGIARLVGERSNGKASMEQSFTLRNNYQTRFIIGALYDPHGHSWHRNGLRPDYHVVNTNGSQDRQLVTAWKLLNQKP